MRIAITIIAFAVAVSSAIAQAPAAAKPVAPVAAPVVTPAAPAAKPVAPAVAPMATSAVAPTPPAVVGVKVAVYPLDIHLETLRDKQTFVVQVTELSGITRDVTEQAQITFANPALVKRDNFTITPVADGATEMIVAFAGQTVKVPLTLHRKNAANVIAKSQRRT